MAAVIGGIASLLVSQQAWPLALLCTLLALATMLCVLLIPRPQPIEQSGV